MSLGKKIRGGFAALLSASLILSGALLVTPAASAVEATPVVSTSVSGVVDETSLSFAVSASGLPGDVSNLYAALVVKGTDPGLGYTAFALPFPSVTAGASVFSLTATVAGSVTPARLPLVEGAQYEVVLWKQHTAATAETIYARADVTISPSDWARLFPPAAPVATATTVTASAASVEVGTAVTLNASVSPATAGTVQFFDGAQPIGTVAIAAGENATVPFTPQLGTHSVQAMFTPSDTSAFLASESTTVVVEAIEASVSETPGSIAPRVEVLGALQNLDPTRSHVVNIRGTGFVQSGTSTNGTRPPLAGKFSGAYVVFGSFLEVWQPSAGAKSAARSIIEQKWALPMASKDTAGASWVELSTDGTFETSLTLSYSETQALANGRFGIYTYSGSGAVYAPFETYTPVTFLPVPKVTIDGALNDLDPTKANLVTVHGSGFVPNAPTTSGSRPPLAGKFTGVYVAFGSYASTWRPSANAPTSTRAGLDVKWAVPTESIATIGGEAAGAIELKADGTFTTTLRLTPDQAKAVADGSWGIATYAGGGSKYPLFETFTPVKFAAPAQDSGSINPVAPASPPAFATVGSLTWGLRGSFITYINRQVDGRIATAGVGGSTGNWIFPQSSSTWDAASGTGTVSYSGSVSFYGHGIHIVTVANPVIRVSGSSGTLSSGGVTVATLNLANATRTNGAGGATTWSGVNVTLTPEGAGSSFFKGYYSAGEQLDPLTFTVGSVSGVSYGATSMLATAALGRDRTPAPAPPATDGIRVITSSDELVAGGEIEFEASGFQPGERGILVVMYSEPTVLDTNAGADANGVVRWIGTLPDDLTGEHTITLQGSINVGKVITIAAAEQVEKTAFNTAEIEDAQIAEVQAAGVSDSDGPGWVIWVGALALLVVAGGLTALVVSQRRRAGGGSL